MRVFTAKEAARRFGEAMKAARHEPVVIAKHGRLHAFVISPEVFAEYKDLKERACATNILDRLDAAIERFNADDGAAGVNILRKLAPLWRQAGVK